MPVSTALRRLRLAAIVLAVLVMAGSAAGAGLVAFLSRDLPRFDALKDYTPREATHVLAADGTEIAAFGDELRTVVPPGEIPEVMKRAILAAEDAHFYQHEGLDYAGIARAAIKNLLPGGRLQGASTITQQVVKTFLLSPERSLRRKIPEMVLALRLEKNLSKDEILYLYLNQIYFGHRRYGVEEAARLFVGKHVRDLDIGEAALLAGLVQSPARLSPFNHPEAAKQRQTYVLDRMLENGWITKGDHEREVARPLPLAARVPDPPGEWYVEEARRYLVERYGEEKVLTGGLTVQVGMDPALQARAEAALHEGLLGYDRRHGFRGPTGKLDAARRSEVAAVLAKKADPRLLADVETGKLVGDDPGSVVAGAVEKVDARSATVWLGGPTVVLAAGDAWPGRELPALAPGDVVRVELGPPAAPRTARLWQAPEVEGALVALDPHTREVRALVGGFDIQRSSFDRAIQARRQPGSSFKAFVFGAALESGRWSPASLVVDAPETIRDPWTGKEWRPQNYERNEFEGTMTFGRALALSKNTVAVRLITELGVAPVVDFARRAGIRSDLPDNFTLALGTGEVTPLEMASAYGTLAAGGLHADPVLVTRVTGRDGTVLEENRPRPRPVISPAIAYVLTRLLEGVVQDGTGHAAAVIDRPLAGKTGTTSDGKDAWFAAYTPDLVAVSWVGFDDHARSLGRGETGARTALPAAVAFLQGVLADVPVRDFEVPEGVVLADIDPATGLLSADGSEGQSTAFVEGTAPRLHALAPGLAPADTPAQLFLGEPGDRVTLTARAGSRTTRGALALAALLSIAAAPPSSSMVQLAAELAGQVAAATPGDGRLALRVQGDPGLARALEVELAAALRGRGLPAAVHAAGEDVARAAGADALVDLRVGLSSAALTAAGSLTPVRENFFTGSALVAGAVLQAQVAPDAAARLLAGPAPAGAPRLDVLATLPDPVLAVAAGDLDGAAPDEVVVLTARAVHVFSRCTPGAACAPRATFSLPPGDPSARACRDPVGGVAVLGREVLWSVPSLGRGGRLRLGVVSCATGPCPALVPSGELAELPLASGSAGLLAGSAVPGRNHFAPALRLLSNASDPAPRAGDAPTTILSAAMAPRSPALGVVTTALTFVPLTPDLAPAGSPVPGVGTAALADLDGDGTPELVAASTSPDAPDHVRIAAGSLRFESGDVPARLLAAAAGDLDGDGRDDAIFAGATAALGGIVMVVHAGEAPP